MSEAPLATPHPPRDWRPAADPEASVWVAASAGTGKTSVLTDRVLALLLAGTPPARILCLTFTKAAAAEMANRIADRLGRWATVTDAELAQDVGKLTDQTPQDDLLQRARRLFARVIDAPGGLKIETIHAFCQSLLRRFPLEAGVVPHFQVMDERSAAELMDRARDGILLRAWRGVDEALAAALREVTGHIQEDEFRELMAGLARERGRLARLATGPRELESAIAAVYRCLGLRPGEDKDAVLAAALANDALDARALGAAAAALAAGSKDDQERGRIIAAWLTDQAKRGDQIDEYRKVFLTGEGEVRQRLATKAVLEAAPEVEGALRAEAERLTALGERIKAADTAAATAALLTLGGAVLAAYERHKAEEAMLDYDDLILEARRLLESRGADWVLYKLDKGLDHILIDEAQDTNPDQWRVIALLADEFFAGEGAREERRTIFAVGDAKQSIFSFQRADPAAFDAMRRRFAERARAAGSNWHSEMLSKSFRSTPAVLRAVDGVFGRAGAADGVGMAGEAIRHVAFRRGRAGLVELWPAVTARERAAPAPWLPPLSREPTDSPPGRLAACIAARVKRWLKDGEPLPSMGRKVRAGDIMVLVRRRTVFVDELVHALKKASVPVAGIDRMVLTDQLAVMDLMALARFLLLPEDDLTLASVLKSPLVGLAEEQLFDLAFGRGEHSLWHELDRRADEDAAYASAHAYLAGLLSRVDFLRPYELFAEVLGARGAAAARSGRQRIIARLGPEAEEPLDELLALALAYERAHVPSLEGFLRWAESGRAEIKRDPEASARDEVRIMTVHGAKGLEAPIVILPDTLQAPKESPRLLWFDGGKSGLLWPPRRAYEERVATALRSEVNRKRDQEYRRLLYVAMTRAEDRLYVCGWRGTSEPPADCWYNLVRDGLTGIAEPFAFDCTAEIAEGWAGEGLRLVSPQEASIEREHREAALPVSHEPLPAWTRQPAPPEPLPPRPLAPSRPTEEEPAVRSPLGADEGLRFRRGIIIHRLLELLPELPTARRAAACRRYLARSAHGLAKAERDALAAETLAVLADPAFAPLFGRGSRAEVALAGLINGRVISGQVDRLLVAPQEVLAVDYKTNRLPPVAVNEVPALYLRQMAAYRALLRAVYPGRQVRMLLLWTEGPRRMLLPDGALDPYAP